MATGTIKSQMKYIDTQQLTFTVSNYLGRLNLATILNIDKQRIIQVMPTVSAGWQNTSPTFVYTPSTGEILLYSTIASATMIATFRVIYI